MKQEVVSIVVVLFQQSEVTQHLSFCQLIAWLLVEEIAEGVFARGERHCSHNERQSKYTIFLHFRFFLNVLELEYDIETYVDGLQEWVTV
ncbi:Uncharacterised protein [Segatella copri]|nr:Uncharacterised protein [Segatella copri]